MSDLARIIAELSPEKRALLEKRIRESQDIPAAKKPSVLRRGVEVAPLSFAQEQLWFLYQLEPESPFYNTSRALYLQGLLNRVALERGLNELVQRHQILRTTFMDLDGLPIQKVVRADPLPLRCVDLRGLADQKRESETRRLLECEARKLFILQQEFPVRWLLLALDTDEHICILTFHHIAFDGWSLQVLLQELGTLYSALHTRSTPALPPLPIQYTDFALWQRERLQGETLEGLLRYWREHLHHAPGQILFPTDYIRPQQPTLRGQRLAVCLPAPLVNALRLLARREGVTLFIVLLSAFQVLLYRYSGQEDLVIGTNVANRFPEECEQLIGLFTNMLALRLKPKAATHFLDLLQHSRQVVASAFAHQELPFERLVEELHPRRTLQRAPLFQIMLVQQPPQRNAPLFARLQLTLQEVDTGAAPFDLVLSAEDQGEELRLTAHYSADLFTTQTVTQLLHHFQNLLENLLAEPDRPVDELSLLTKTEHRQLLLTWSNTENTTVEKPSVTWLFQQQVRRAPDTIALVAGQMQLSYGELNRRTDQLAQRLRGLGIGLEDCVGICFERTPELVIALLGILKAGGAYVPLDPGYPQARLEFMLADSQARLLLTRTNLCALFEHCRLPQLYLDEEQPVYTLDASFQPDNEVSPTCAAYIIYTSGSTGQPKGVLVSRQALACFVHESSNIYALGPGIRQGQLVSPGFDVLGEELFLPLCCGGSVVLGYDPASQSALELLHCIEQDGVNKINMPASYWHQVVDELAEQRQGPPACLQILTTGAESPSLEKLFLWQSLVGHPLRFFNVYGPTEATIITTTYEISRPGRSLEQGVKIPMGRPMPGWQVYILDEHLQPVPPGLPGELYIGGSGLARGYVGRPDITAERFIPHLWSAEPGARLYRTGDRARYLLDGNLEFAGRADYQVKMRGFRIELEEIEAALKKHPGVKDALVLLRETAPGHKQLCAYIIPASSLSVLRSVDLQPFLRKWLPEYMVPTSFITLAAFPLSSNSKIDRRALPLPARDALREEIDYVPPEKAAEQALAEIWSQILHRERIGIHDNFFELGGDSITSLQVVAHARRAGLRLLPKQLFEYHTIAELAQVALPIADETYKAPLPLPEHSFPLTPIQSWFFEQELPNLHHWNQALWLEFAQEPDLIRLAEALNCLVNFHSALRLRFRQENGIWRQYITGSARTIAIEHLEMARLNDEGQEAVEKALTGIQASLSLIEGPLLRAVWTPATQAQGGRLFLAIHHLAVDRVSWSIFLDDLQYVYCTLVQGKTLALPLSTTLPEWVAFLQHLASSEVLNQERPYWLEMSYSKAEALPLDYERDIRAVNTMDNTRTVNFMLDEQETQAFLRLAAQEKARTEEMLLTALLETFVHWTGKHSLLLDRETHGRETFVQDIDLSRTIGWFTAQSPLLLTVPEMCDPELAPDQLHQKDLLAHVQKTLQQIPAGGAGYGVLRYLSSDDALRSTLRAAPVAQVGFNYLGQMDAGLSSEKLFTLSAGPRGALFAGSAPRLHLFDVTCSISREQLSVSWLYCELLHLQETVVSLGEHFCAALRALLSQYHAMTAIEPRTFENQVDSTLTGLSPQKLERILHRARRPRNEI